jgi:hypothetical protein
MPLVRALSIGLVALGIGVFHYGHLAIAHG